MLSSIRQLTDTGVHIGQTKRDATLIQRVSA